MIKFRCERCAATIQCPDTNVGKNVVCPTCRHKQVVPKREVRKPNWPLLAAGGASIVVLAILAWVMFGPKKPPPAPTPTETDRNQTAGKKTERKHKAQLMTDEKRKALIDTAKRIARKKHEEDCKERMMRDRAQLMEDAKRAVIEEGRRREREQEMERKRQAREKIEYERRLMLKEAAEREKKLKESSMPR